MQMEAPLSLQSLETTEHWLSSVELRTIIRTASANVLLKGMALAMPYQTPASGGFSR